MSEAIDRALAQPPEWAGLSTTPSLPGLRRRALLPLDVLAPSLAAAKPAAAALLVPVVVTAYVGPGAWLSVVVAVMIALLVRSVLGEFTSRVVTAGSLYTFVVRGLGAWAGLITAVAMVIAYGFGSGYALTSTGVAVHALGHPHTSGPVTLGLTDVLLVLAVGIGCGLVLIRGVSTFTSVTLVIQAVTIAAVGVLVTVVLLSDGDLGQSLSLSGASPARIVTGATLVLALLAGFECSASHGAEAAQPFKSVPRAMTVSVLVTGILCLVTTIALAADPAASLQALHHSVRVEHVWFSDEQTTAIVLYRATRVLSLVACTLAMWAAMTRLVFTLAREGVLPSVLARTHPRLLTPQRAVLITAPLVIVPGAVLVSENHRLQVALGSLLDTTGLVMLVVYLLVCLAAPAFLVRIGELTGQALAVSAATAGVLVVALSTHIAWQPERGDLAFVAGVAATVIPLATLWYVVLRLRRPAVLDRMGLHDQTIASDSWCRPA
jgi:amino acid transporter